MIRITQISLPIHLDQDGIEAALCAELGPLSRFLISWQIFRRSLDARRGREFRFIYTFDITLKDEKAAFQRAKRAHRNWQYLPEPAVYQIPQLTAESFRRPLVVGLGPAGLFCGLLLARQGLRPLIVERGRPVEKRRLDTQLFFKKAILDPTSNVQFGEGGAGTFSDGKLTTLIKDPSLRGRFVLNEFVKAGAPDTILYDAKPHMGTDRLQQVVKAMRQELLALGAEIRFETTLTDFIFTENKEITGAVLTSQGKRTVEEVSAVFLGIGHSARDTFAMLQKSGIPMTPKPFAMGLRIEHPRTMIDQVQHREYAGSPFLGAADYKLTHQTSGGRGVYTFCMCPGGVVVAATSEPEQVVTNGMSDYARANINSNSALLVTVTPEDFSSYASEGDVLAGVYFQRDLEHKTYLLGGSDYSAPIQCAGDFILDKPSTDLGDVLPSYTGTTKLSNLREILPPYMSAAIAEGIQAFGQKLKGFDRHDALLTGVESRSSSPVRILRGDDMQSQLRGLYPMGEGAGYAGGIMSAAIDGMKAAEAYIEFLNSH